MQHHILPRARVDRRAFVVNFCRGKTVLHLGCADYPLTEQRIRTGQLLHDRITRVASRCLGVDLDAQALEILRRNGFDNVVVGDAERLGELSVGRFDIVLAGEMIEHVNNPGLFLASCREVLKPNGHLVITTINAFCLRRMLRIPFGVESVHADHTYYFSHSTLATLTRRFGFAPEARYGYSLSNRKPILPYFVERLASWVSPNLGEGIVHVYRRSGDAESR